MGCVISALGAGLLIARGFSIGLAALIVVGLVLFGLGLVWRWLKHDLNDSVPNGTRPYTR